MSATPEPTPNAPEPAIVWRPQEGPQKALVDCPHTEVFFGGARGGGKTDGVLGKWALKERRYGADFNAIMFRRTTIASEDAIERSKQIYEPLGAKYNESKRRWRMPNGGRVSFAYLDSVDDAQQYQGRNLTDAWVEEAGQYPDPAPIDRLFGTLRSAAGVPVQLVLTANPGGPGQHWISERYGLVPFPRKPQLASRTLRSGKRHVAAVIPSRITDNKLLLESDPDYIDRLQLVGSDALVRAWLEGDWAAIEGAFFDCWDARTHIVEPFAVPKGWTRFRSFDWGSARPFSVGWWAIVGDDHKAGSIRLPRGALLRYREWYGARGANKGLKLTTEEVARGIIERDGGEALAYSVADPAIFTADGGPSRAEIFAQHGVHFMRADNKRVSGHGAMGGWDEMRQRLKGMGGVPMLFVSAHCRDFIRTVPVLPHDPARPEDIDTDAEDHIADEARYACMSRPWVADAGALAPRRARDWFGDPEDDAASAAANWKIL
ncbi:terminase [Starkeya sp. ORNL1]|uniref:phage terminase large subunit n=1 Tax=Starkeya sp. ORNL1 TaxID=2709380 RepID=UPI0014641CC9|nr:phage terminase large subunit [Starkeya sp. ORNL1]QJP13736.1 terminase [Starkeya sp. ORNL1]